jgi:hypothetical protein
VGATRILVTVTRNGRQLTVYENVVGQPAKRKSVGSQTNFHRDGDGKVVFGKAPADVQAKRDAEKKAEQVANAKNAMILPAPLKSGQKIQVLDLSKDSFSFKTLHTFFPKILTERDIDAPRGRGMPTQSFEKLEVLSVGNYFISLAESLDDLDRIDSDVFTVSPNIKELFSQHYAKGFGFVVCSFDPEKSMQAHAIGYVHDVLDNGRLFVPTRHQHTVDVKPTEHFDHEIYSINTTADGGAGPSVEEVEKQNAALQKHEFKPYKATADAIGKALKSEVLTSLYPAVILSFRQRIIQGNHANDDFVFTAA